MLDFPCFKAWWKAVLLFIPIYAIPLVIPIFIFWHFLIIGAILTVEQEPTAILAFVTAAGLLAATVIGYFLLIIIHSFSLKIFWNQPPRWLTPPQSLGKKLFHLGVAITATLPIVAINVFYLITIESVEALTQTDIKPLCLPKMMWRLSWVWLIAAAYLYQWQERISQRKRLNNLKQTA